MDTILPEPGSVPAMEESALRVRDLTMAQSFNSGERELSEWVELFASATPKLRLKEWKKPLGSVMSIMVVVRDEENLEDTEKTKLQS
jgi:6-hydroxytryprostatin B O-methyltransferase